MRKLETIIYVQNCPMLKEDNADDTKIILSTCSECEYYKGSSLYLITIKCNYPKKAGVEGETPK